MKIDIYILLGLVKDGKAPKKIKYENREYYLYDNKSYLSTDKTRFFDKIYFSDLNIEVEILDEEEFEYIEELKLDGDFGGDFLINDEGNKCHISSHDKTIVRRINKVIKNQKKIIERLK